MIAAIQIRVLVLDHCTRYFKTLPFFPFQPEDVLVDTSEEFRAKLHLIVNKELIYQLARLGASVKVLAPQRLQNQLNAFLREAWEQYD